MLGTTKDLWDASNRQPLQCHVLKHRYKQDEKDEGEYEIISTILFMPSWHNAGNLSNIPLGRHHKAVGLLDIMTHLVMTPFRMLSFKAVNCRVLS